MKFRVIVITAMVMWAWQVSATDDVVELKRLQTVLATLNQELTATYGQFQIVLEARRASIQQEILEGPRPGLDKRNYDDIVAAQLAARERSRELAKQMDLLLLKVKEIEAEKQPILQQVYAMLRSNPSAPAEQASSGTAQSDLDKKQIDKPIKRRPQ